MLVLVLLWVWVWVSDLDRIFSFSFFRMCETELVVVGEKGLKFQLWELGMGVRNGCVCVCLVIRIVLCQCRFLPHQINASGLCVRLDLGVIGGKKEKKKKRVRINSVDKVFRREFFLKKRGFG